jgi:hypothetical protein
MKTEAKKVKRELKEKEFDTVKTFRTIREKISGDIADMNLEQIKAYLQARKVRLQQE